MIFGVVCGAVFAAGLVFLVMDGNRVIDAAGDSLDEHVASLPVEMIDWTAFERDVFPAWVWHDGPSGSRDRRPE